MRGQKEVKRILSFVLAFVMLLSTMNGILLTVVAADATSTDGFTYEVLDGIHCTITGYTGTSTEIVVPSTIDGYMVQQISDSAFSDCSSLTSITLSVGLSPKGKKV